MHNRDKYPEIWALMEKSREEEAAVFATIDPMKEEIKAITQEIDALKEKKDAVGKRIQEHYPRITEARNQIAACARAMGAKNLHS